MTTEQDLRERMNAEAGDLIDQGEALIAELLAWDPTGHELHGLRPWRTCRFCFRMSVLTFIELPLRNRIGDFGVPSIDDEATLRRWAAVEYRTRPDLAPGLGLAVMRWAMRRRVRPTLHSWSE